MKQQLTSSLGWWPHTNTLTHTCTGGHDSRHLVFPEDGILCHTPGICSSPDSGVKPHNRKTRTNQKCFFFFSKKVLESQLRLGEIKRIPVLYVDFYNSFIIMHRLLLFHLFFIISLSGEIKQLHQYILRYLLSRQ